MRIINKRGFINTALLLLFFLPVDGNKCVFADEAGRKEKSKKLNIAVEFTNHAACFYVAREKGWFKKAGLDLAPHKSYITGLALSAALVRGDIDAAYICIIPAINAFSNGKVPLRVVCGTHKYGYSLLVNPDKVKKISDLEKTDIRIGCSRQGSPPDALVHKMIEKYKLNQRKMLNRLRRMPSPKILLGLKMGQLDAGFCCEQFPTLGEESGLKVLISAQDLWPGMQGSVLVVKEALIKNHPDIVKKLVKITKISIEHLTNHPENCAPIVAKYLSIAKGKIFPIKLKKDVFGLTITPDVILKSLIRRLPCTACIDNEAVQESIDYLSKLGYIKPFKAEKMVEFSFLE
ncbi:ABC transporter substrate-binding protein [Candidatus Riflebacteria bacterium]